MPTLSVLMTAFNAMPYLELAVESVLAQEFTDFEFIIVNDGSTDGTAAYLDSLNDSRLRVFHRQNAGTAAASNFGLQHCQGEFVARMDADDYSTPDRFVTQVAFLNDHPEVGLVGSHVRVMGSKKVGMKIDLPLKHDAIMHALTNLNNGITHGACMFRRSLIEQIGGYWSLRSYDDWDMFVRMGQVTELANIDRVLYHYRYLTTGLVGKGVRIGRRYYGYGVERTRRATVGEAEISFEQYCEQLDSKGFVFRVLEWMEAESLCQYRIATTKIHDGQPGSGRLRLLLAAALSPGRTFRRVRRMLGFGTRTKSAPAALETRSPVGKEYDPIVQDTKKAGRQQPGKELECVSASDEAAES